jgi:predicted RNase H-like HicB family nuclease
MEAERLELVWRKEFARMQDCKDIIIIVEKTDSGFSAYAEKIPVFTTAETVPELMGNAVEAVGLYYEDQDEGCMPGKIRFRIDFQQFFRDYKILNARVLAKRIGMNSTLLSQYVKGYKQPSDKQAEKILYGIQQIGRELSEMHFL